MIKEFKNNEVRDSGLIYNSTLNQIRQLYQTDPAKAGELAISAIELVLTGDTSTDDMMIDILLEPLKVVNVRNKNKWDAKVETAKQKKIESQKLDQIAALATAGIKQGQIAKQLGLTQQTVSNRLKLIRSEFPELLGDGRTSNFNTLQDSTNKNVCTNFTSNSTNNLFVQDCTSENTCKNSTNNLQAVQEKSDVFTSNSSENTNKNEVTSKNACTNFVQVVKSEVDMKDKKDKPKKYFDF